jgi:hypothetical protein
MKPTRQQRGKQTIFKTKLPLHHCVQADGRKILHGHKHDRLKFYIDDCKQLSNELSYYDTKSMHMVVGESGFNRSDD